MKNISFVQAQYQIEHKEEIKQIRDTLGELMALISKDSLLVCAESEFFHELIEVSMALDKGECGEYLINKANNLIEKSQDILNDPKYEALRKVFSKMAETLSQVNNKEIGL